MLLPSFLKLVAIATIADSVPLTGENRAIAAVGLAALANPVQPGLRALMQLAKIPLDRAPTATEVGFRLAPRINAAGRMDIADDVVELLLTRDAARARELAVKLDGLNQERRDSEARALEAIDRELQPCGRCRPASIPRECLILDHPEWHRGVLGILASRVVERTGRPAIIVTHADGDAHGSGRSVPGFHLLDAITAADAVDPAEPLFHRFGGHAHAVGFSLPSDRLPLLRSRMKAYASTRLTPALLVPQLEYDAELSLAEITPELMAWVARLAPFGIGNPEPVFLTRNATLAAPVRLIQEQHIALQLTQRGPPATINPAAIPALGWSRDPLGWPARCTRLALAKGSAVDVLYRLRHNARPTPARSSAASNSSSAACGRPAQRCTPSLVQQNRPERARFRPQSAHRLRRNICTAPGKKYFASFGAAKRLIYWHLKTWPLLPRQIGQRSLQSGVQPSSFCLRRSMRSARSRASGSACAPPR